MVEYESIRKVVIENAIDASAEVFKEACMKIAFELAATNPHLIAAFEIDITTILRPAFEKAVRGYEDGTDYF